VNSRATDSHRAEVRRVIVVARDSGDGTVHSRSSDNVAVSHAVSGIGSLAELGRNSLAILKEGLDLLLSSVLEVDGARDLLNREGRTLVCWKSVRVPSGYDMF
jgi:hypothetical protein